MTYDPLYLNEGGAFDYSGQVPATLYFTNSYNGVEIPVSLRVDGPVGEFVAPSLFAWPTVPHVPFVCVPAGPDPIVTVATPEPGAGLMFAAAVFFFLAAERVRRGIRG
jgi:hypothetical protein